MLKLNIGAADNGLILSLTQCITMPHLSKLQLHACLMPGFHSAVHGRITKIALHLVRIAKLAAVMCCTCAVQAAEGPCEAARVPHDSSRPYSRRASSSRLSIGRGASSSSTHSTLPKVRCTHVRHLPRMRKEKLSQ